MPAAAIIAGIGDVTRFDNTGELLLGRPDPAGESGTLVFYGLRDGQIRCLFQDSQNPASLPGTGHASHARPYASRTGQTPFDMAPLLTGMTLLMENGVGGHNEGL